MLACADGDEGGSHEQYLRPEQKKTLYITHISQMYGSDSFLCVSSCFLLRGKKNLMLHPQSDIKETSTLPSCRAADLQAELWGNVRITCSGESSPKATTGGSIWMLDLLLDVEKICQRSAVSVLVALMKPPQRPGNEALRWGRSFTFYVGEKNHYQPIIRTVNIK